MHIESWFLDGLLLRLEEIWCEYCQVYLFWHQRKFFGGGGELRGGFIRGIIIEGGLIEGNFKRKLTVNLKGFCQWQLFCVI